MRLLITTDTVGGVWTFTSELSEELLRRGHDVALVSFGGSPSAAQTAWAERQTSAFSDHFSYTPSDTPLEWMQENTRALPEGEAVLHRVAEHFQPDLLVSNQFCFGAITARLPRVVIAHSDVLSWAKAAKPSALEPSPWLNQYTSLVQMGLMQADALLAPTSSVLRDLKVNFFLPASGTVIPNGRRLPPAASRSERRLQAVTAGRLWDEAKGLDLLRATELPLPVLLAGDLAPRGDEATHASAAHLQVLGPLEPEALYNVFRESAIYLCTSLYEPFGLAPLEAGLCGCAVVARDLPSLREVWGDSALYFTTAEQLQGQLRMLVHVPEALAEAQVRSRRRAALFTVERMTDAYLSAFDAVVRRKALHVA